MSSIWVISEDFARAAIGPFDSTPAAEEHIKYITDRGDGGAENAYIYHAVDSDQPNAGQHFSMTPEQDKEFDDTCPKCNHHPRFGMSEGVKWCTSCKSE